MEIVYYLPARPFFVFANIGYLAINQHGFEVKSGFFAPKSAIFR
jgi:hypothetical protein